MVLTTIFFLLIYDFVAFHLTAKWQLFFSYYDGYRLPASITAFLPFTRETIHKERNNLTIIFPGDSTSGGLIYHHSQTIPAYLNNALLAKHKSVRTFNLPLSGAHLSEQYLIMKEVIEDADIIIFPIHYSFFSGRGPGGSSISHPEIVESLTKAQPGDLALLNLSPRSWLDETIETNLEKIWYTYRVRKILPYIIFAAPIKSWFTTAVSNHLPKTIQTHQTSIAINIDLSFQYQSPEVQQMIIKQNVLLWQKINFIDEENINLQYLRKIAELKKKNTKKFIAYFVPLDIQTMKKFNIFDELKYKQIITFSKKILRDYSIPFVDFNEHNPANLNPYDFYNPDHLLPQGNKKIGEYFAQLINHDL